ncbi:MAG TPA: 3-oxoacyl-ACP reductase FabG [Thermoanaerobacterales bacterium]|nr:3-oxoacyl-ACP reductase FabG [Thermoanaerobacterales bacterium]
MSIDMALEGKVAIVTGGTSGIGKAIAVGLAEAGADVIPTSRSIDKVKETVDMIRQMGRKSLEIPTDVTKPEDVAELVKKVLQEYGKIDILVNSAGMTVQKLVKDLSLEEWDEVINLNLRGAFVCCKFVGDAMISQGSGKIINIASIGGQVAIGGAAPYCASKGGLIQLTKVLAVEWSKYHIYVNAIAPGYIRTPLNEQYLNEEGKLYKKIIGRVPLKRLGNADDLKGLAVFLASQASNYITGQVIYVDGGMLAFGI